MSVRVNILLANPGGIRSGHLNLDLAVREPQPDGRLPGAVADWPQVSPNEAEEVIALDILDKLPPEHVEEAFRYWVSRLAHGGKLTVSALDYAEAARYLWDKPADVGLANAVLYGRRSAHTFEALVALAEGCGLKVEKTWWDDLRIFLVATRP